MAIVELMLELGGEVFGRFYKKLPWYVYFSILAIGFGLSVYLDLWA